MRSGGWLKVRESTVGLLFRTDDAPCTFFAPRPPDPEEDVEVADIALLLSEAS